MKRSSLARCVLFPLLAALSTAVVRVQSPLPAVQIPTGNDWVVDISQQGRFAALRRPKGTAGYEDLLLRDLLTGSERILVSASPEGWTNDFVFPCRSSRAHSHTVRAQPGWLAGRPGSVDEAETGAVESHQLWRDPECPLIEPGPLLRTAGFRNPSVVREKW